MHLKLSARKLERPEISPDGPEGPDCKDYNKKVLSWANQDSIWYQRAKNAEKPKAHKPPPSHVSERHVLAALRKQRLQKEKEAQKQFLAADPHQALQLFRQWQSEVLCSPITPILSAQHMVWPTGSLCLRCVLDF